VDVANDPGSREKLAALGLRSVPIVARGEQWVDGQNLEVVAKFVGLDGTGHVPLPPDVLYARLQQILTVAQACVRQVPADKLTQDATHNRKRDLRLLSHHLFRIVEAYLEVAEDGVFFSRGLPQIELADGTFTTSAEIADYGAQVMARLERWWNRGQGHDFEREVDTYFGKLSLHRLLERSTWHPAQHTRQLISVLESFGIQPAMALTPALLEGLPLPERLWE
jgi:hypothetical protein